VIKTLRFIVSVERASLAFYVLSYYQHAVCFRLYFVPQVKRVYAKRIEFCHDTIHMIQLECRCYSSIFYYGRLNLQDAAFMCQRELCYHCQCECDSERVSYKCETQRASPMFPL